MTIVAYRDGMLAADSLETVGDVRSGDVRKLYRVKGAIVGFAGSRPAIDAALAWMRGVGERPEDFGEDDFRALVVEPDGSAWELNHALKAWRLPGEFTAIGGAWRLGMGAMGFGASAVQAAQVAIDLCVNCGGPIRWITLDAEGELMAGGIGIEPAVLLGRGRPFMVDGQPRRVAATKRALDMLPPTTPDRGEAPWGRGGPAVAQGPQAEGPHVLHGDFGAVALRPGDIRPVAEGWYRLGDVVDKREGELLRLVPRFADGHRDWEGLALYQFDLPGQLCVAKPERDRPARDDVRLKPARVRLVIRWEDALRWCDPGTCRTLLRRYGEAKVEAMSIAKSLRVKFWRSSRAEYTVTVRREKRRFHAEFRFFVPEHGAVVKLPEHEITAWLV